MNLTKILIFLLIIILAILISINIIFDSNQIKLKKVIKGGLDHRIIDHLYYTLGLSQIDNFEDANIGKFTLFELFKNTLHISEEEVMQKYKKYIEYLNKRYLEGLIYFQSIDVQINIYMIKLIFDELNIRETPITIENITEFYYDNYDILKKQDLHYLIQNDIKEYLSIADEHNNLLACLNDSSAPIAAHIYAPISLPIAAPTTAPTTAPKKILILGAGPVGLITAHRLLSLHENIHVTLVDVRTSYTRQQVLVIQPDMYDQIKNFIYPPNIQYGHKNSIFGSTFLPRINFNICIENGAIISEIRDNLRDILELIIIISQSDPERISEIIQEKIKKSYIKYIVNLNEEDYNRFIEILTSHGKKDIYVKMLTNINNLKNDIKKNNDINSDINSILIALEYIDNQVFEEDGRLKDPQNIHLVAYEDSNKIKYKLKENAIITVTISDLESALFTSLELKEEYHNRYEIIRPSHNIDNKCASYEIEFGMDEIELVGEIEIEKAKIENKNVIDIFCITKIKNGRETIVSRTIDRRLILSNFSLIFSSAGGRDIFSQESRSVINKFVKYKDSPSFDGIPFTNITEEDPMPVYTHGAVIYLTENKESSGVFEKFMDFSKFKFSNIGISGINRAQDRYRIFVQPSVFSLNNIDQKSIYMGIQFKDGEWGDGDKNEYLKKCCELGCRLFDIPYENFDIPESIVTFPIHIFKLSDFIFTFRVESNELEWGNPQMDRFKKIPICLLGDSIIGVNFFSGTGVNFGFQSALICTESESISLLTSSNFEDNLDKIHDTYNPLKNVDASLQSSYNVTLKYEILSTISILDLRQRCLDKLKYFKIYLSKNFLDKIIIFIDDNDNLLPLYYFLESIQI